MRSIVEVGASVPAFLAKLWKLVNDSETNHLISWNLSGKTFIIKNQADFARELLPLYYKHNNMASFIRQLNMYGFHKITSVENGGLRYEKDEIEFSHPCFMRGHSYLLEHIKRKIANPKAILACENGEKVVIKSEIMNKVLGEVKQMKGKQENMDAKFSVMKQENEALWREVALLRQKHIKQQKIVNNLIQFLMSMVGQQRQGCMNPNVVGGKRGFQLMINSAAHNAPNKMPRIDGESSGSPDAQHEDNNEEGPTIHELAHDDILHGTDGLSEYLTIEVPAVSANVHFDRVSPNLANAQATKYHVTMADGDDTSDADRILSHTSPLCTSPMATSPLNPSPVNPQSPLVQTPPPNDNTPLLQPASVSSAPRARRDNNQSFSTIPAVNNKPPADIFEETETAVQYDSLEYQPVKDNLLGMESDLSRTLTQGSYSKSKDSSKKSKNKSKKQPQLSFIKQEQDDLDWGEMSLATLDDNNYNADNISTAEDLDDHLDTMQSDLDSLREMLKNDNFSFDTNTLIGSSELIALKQDAAVSSLNSLQLFGQDDLLYNLYNTNYDERPNKGRKRKSGVTLSECTESDLNAGPLAEDLNTEQTDASNQLMSYTGHLPDLTDFELSPVEDVTESTETSDFSPNSILNTPHVTLSSPFRSAK